MLSLLVAIVVLGLLLATSDGTAQETKAPVIISSSPIPVGSGARAAGVGNAFIAVADDATAASWNPAGLSQLERPEVSAVGAYFHRDDKIGMVVEDLSSVAKRLTPPGADTTQSLNLNYLSAVLPFTLLKRNITVSLNYQMQYNFNRQFALSTTEFLLTDELCGAAPCKAYQLDFSLDQGGSLYALSPALSVRILPSLSVGATLNVWGSFFFQDSAWQSTRSNRKRFFFPDGTVAGQEYWVEREDFRGFFGVNATFGMLWKPTDRLSLGAVVELPFRAGLDLDVTVEDLTKPATDPGRSYGFRRQLKMDFPLSFGFGLAYRPMDKLTFSLDYVRVQWQDFVVWDETGRKYSVLTGDKTGPDGEADVDPTDTFRLGVEYLFILSEVVWPVRAGVFHEPEPARGSPDSFVGFSVGTGVSWWRLNFDLAYVFRAGTGIRVTNLDILGNIPSATEDVYRHNLMFSLVFYL